MRNLSFASEIFLILLAAGLSTPRPARAAEEIAAAQEVAEVDRAYAQLALEKGMPAASVAYFAPDGIAFAPLAVNGRKYWSEREDFPGTLIWQPIFATATRAADLAYTTGPWELKKEAERSAPAYGQYVSIWSKQADGTWKMVLDVGTDNAQPAEPPAALQLAAPDLSAGTRPLGRARRALAQTQRNFFEAAQEDIGKAMIANASEDIRVYRQNSFPAVGINAAQLMLSADHGKVKREFSAPKISRSGDLAYSYGNYSQPRGNLVESGIYVTIWRINLNGDWKLIVDLQKKHPDKL